MVEVVLQVVQVVMVHLVVEEDQDILMDQSPLSQIH